MQPVTILPLSQHEGHLAVQVLLQCYKKVYHIFNWELQGTHTKWYDAMVRLKVYQSFKNLKLMAAPSNA